MLGNGFTDQLLGDLLGKSKIVEGFYQYFLFGDVKGEMQPSHFDRIVKATESCKGNFRRGIKK